MDLAWAPMSGMSASHLIVSVLSPFRLLVDQNGGGIAERKSSFTLRKISTLTIYKRKWGYKSFLFASVNPFDLFY